MTYEKDIPDYALVPAREPEERVLIPITQGAVYSPVQVTNITEKPKAIITIEEDILVPDTKPDLKEILMIDGKVRLSGREIDQISKGEDSVSLSGDVELQTLYLPERSDVCGPMISVTSRITFREQWHTELTTGAVLTLDSKIEKIEYMVINERKYRVKISLSVCARECLDSRIDVFEGLMDEEIQTLREKIEITNLAMRKKDILSIKEDLEIPPDQMVESILRQDIHVVENYRQATAEKVVASGFIYVNLLYSLDSPSGSSAPASAQTDKGTDTGADKDMHMGADAGAEGRSDGGSIDGTERICQLQERIEFTQFIPLGQGSQWSGSNLCFDGSDLKVKLTQSEEGMEIFRLEGDIVTWIDLYRNVEKELIVDGYHREKDFICDFETASCQTLVGQATGEATVREIISLENLQGEVERILYAAGELTGGTSQAEAGKVVTEGVLCGKLICLCSDNHGGSRIITTRHDVPFRCVTSAPQMTGSEMVSNRIYMKDLWVEKINSKQVELNGTVLVTSEMMCQKPFKVLKNPAFEEREGAGETKPMVVYIVKEGDDLWSIAKKFKTTRVAISQLNQMESESLAAGQKLLILK